MYYLMSTGSGIRRLISTTALWTTALVGCGLSVIFPNHGLGTPAIVAAVGANTLTVTMVIDHARRKVQQHMTVLEAERHHDGDGNGHPSGPHPRFRASSNV